VSDLIPPIDYSSRDFVSLRNDLVRLIPAYLPEWTSRSESDPGMVLIELFAYQGDILQYYIDRAANEAYLGTAVQRASVLTLASMLDYRPSGRAAATTELQFTVPSGYGGGSVLVPAGTKVSTVTALGQEPIIFETDEDVTVAVGTSELVPATEGETYEESTAAPVGVSDGSANQSFSLYHSTIIDGSIEIYVDEDGGGSGTAALYRYTTHLIDAGSTERVYTTFTNESGVVTVFFGDNVNGRIPPQGAVITAVYRIGVGAQGNVGANTITQPVTALLGISQVTNPAAATGGADEESIADIRRNAPRSLGTLQRAVTTEDYEVLALQVPGVALAHAEAGVYTAVDLAVAPVGGGAPTTALKNDVENYLADKKMINTTITVVDPTYVPINITVNPLHVLPQYSRAAVKLAVENALAALFDFSNVDFGQRITLSIVYRTIAAVEGVDYSTVTVMSTGGAGTTDIVLAADEIPSVGTVTVTATGGLIGS
jgi:uncharacterized phage protein gp47/JayE